MFCAKCGNAVPGGALFCSGCGQPVAAGSRAQAHAPSAAVVVIEVGGKTAACAGFWLRCAAALIDSFVLGIPLGAVFIVLMLSFLPALTSMQGDDPRMAVRMVMTTILPRILLFLLIYLVVSWLYWAGMESSEWQATLGKKAMGIYVTDLEGRRTTFGRASGRFFAGRGISMVPSLGGLYILVDCIMAGFTEKKQALHDMIASCLVLRKT